MSTEDQFRNAMTNEFGCSIHESMARGLSEAQAFAELAEHEQAQYEKNGWVAHYVFDDDPQVPEGMINCHTHGLVESLNHPDFQIVLPLPPETAHGILRTLVERIREGDQFRPGDLADEIIREYQVAFAMATECDRPVIRVILPASDGILDRKKMTGDFAQQWKGTKRIRSTK
jgi:hypothetical protein